MVEVPEIKKQIEFEQEYVVEDQHIAKFLGSGDVEVLSTPAMILFMENTSRSSMEDILPKNLTTVGTHVNVRHLKPAPKGAKIRVVSKLVKQEGRRLLFEVKVFWGNDLIGEGTHERYIVDREKFLKKVKEKMGVKR